MRSSISWWFAEPFFAHSCGSGPRKVIQMWVMTPGPWAAISTCVAPGATRKLSELLFSSLSPFGSALVSYFPFGPCHVLEAGAGSLCPDPAGRRHTPSAERGSGQREPCPTSPRRRGPDTSPRGRSGVAGWRSTLRGRGGEARVGARRPLDGLHV